MTEADWMTAGVYLAALVMGGTLFMTALAHRTLSKLKAQGH